MTRLMTRPILTVAALAAPVHALAQVAPPAPPPPPLPLVAPAVRAPQAPPAPPALPAAPARAPRAPRAPRLLEEQRMEDALRAAQDAVAAVDTGALREATSRAMDEARQALERARVSDWPHLLDEARWRAEEALWDQQTFVTGLSRSEDGDSQYSSGLSYLNQRQYDQAIVRFDRVIARKTTRVDAALYWKAYALYKLSKSTEALEAIAQLRREFAQSRYLPDARALETDARRTSGQPVNPANLDDDEIKLLAIAAMQNAEPARAIPLLEGVLGNTNSLAVKKRALYVLALSADAKAHQILVSYAKGAGNPDLQMEAIRYVATGRDRQTTSAELKQIYESTTDTGVKLAVINAYRGAGDKPSLLAIAGQSVTPIGIRQQAISGLTSLAAPQELWTLYAREESRDLRLQMVSAFGSMQAVDQLNQVLKTEKDAEVRRRTVRALGGLRPEVTGKMLADMYGAETDVDTRKAVISALSSQNNAEALVAIARKETSLDLKRDLVRRLSDMAPRSKVAADYLMEIIK